MGTSAVDFHDFLDTDRLLGSRVFDGEHHGIDVSKYLKGTWRHSLSDISGRLSSCQYPGIDLHALDF